MHMCMCMWARAVGEWKERERRGRGRGLGARAWPCVRSARRTRSSQRRAAAAMRALTCRRRATAQGGPCLDTCGDSLGGLGLQRCLRSQPSPRKAAAPPRVRLQPLLRLQPSHGCRAVAAQLLASLERRELASDDEHLVPVRHSGVRAAPATHLVATRAQRPWPLLPTMCGYCYGTTATTSTAAAAASRHGTHYCNAPCNAPT